MAVPRALARMLSNRYAYPLTRYPSLRTGSCVLCLHQRHLCLYEEHTKPVYRTHMHNVSKALYVFVCTIDIA